MQTIVLSFKDDASMGQVVLLRSHWTKFVPCVVRPGVTLQQLVDSLGAESDSLLKRTYETSAQFALSFRFYESMIDEADEKDRIRYQELYDRGNIKEVGNPRLHCTQISTNSTVAGRGSKIYPFRSLHIDVLVSNCCVFDSDTSSSFSAQLLPYFVPPIICNTSDRSDLSYLLSLWL
ncbi:hypothetical protein QCA50_016906 [Cerrena zonata]|uniref:Uncharacterized protein n=1 Tax=Cerrena zonata TaxID=2478898 RepID=A0AAW0FTE5_9APHY